VKDDADSAAPDQTKLFGAIDGDLDVYLLDSALQFYLDDLEKPRDDLVKP
jgi:hypothetical protein